MSHAGSVLITTGFPTHFTHQPPEENDGPPGALAIAAMLQALEKQVAIVTDQRAMDLNKKIIEEAVKLGKRYGVLILLICAKVCFSFNLSLSTGLFSSQRINQNSPCKLWSSLLQCHFVNPAGIKLMSIYLGTDSGLSCLR